MTGAGISGELLMAKHSAGLLLYRRRPRGLEVFLVHPGGPFWAGKDDGAWSIPKNSSRQKILGCWRGNPGETGFAA
jgi:predicted NUDIX family NTP pyrophosphohydrolase